MANPFEPRGSASKTGSMPAVRVFFSIGLPYIAASFFRSIDSISPPMLPSLKASAIHGSKWVISLGLTSGWRAR